MADPVLTISSAQVTSATTAVVKGKCTIAGDPMNCTLGLALYNGDLPVSTSDYSYSPDPITIKDGTYEVTITSTTLTFTDLTVEMSCTHNNNTVDATSGFTALAATTRSR
jgi:hypothetical protein